MLARFGKRAKLFADEGQVVVGVGIAGVEAHGLPQMLSRRFELSQLLQQASQVVSASYLVRKFESGVFRRFLRGPQCHQRFEGVGYLCTV